jgi:hypothetical protein
VLRGEHQHGVLEERSMDERPLVVSEGGKAHPPDGGTECGLERFDRDHMRDGSRPFPPVSGVGRAAGRAGAAPEGLA